MISTALSDLDDLELITMEGEHERKIRKFRSRLDPMRYFEDNEIFNRFRMSKEVLLELFEYVEPALRHTTKRNHAIHPLTQMLIAFRFYVTGDHYATIGDVFHVHVSTVSRCVTRVTEAFLPHVHRFVRMPEPASDELDEIRNNFYEKTTLPKIIGAIDGTHIKMMRPVGGIDAPYINRKGYPSINVLACCDHRRRIRYFQAKWPGSCHDSTILKSTDLFKMFEDGKYDDCLLLGDSGYGQREWLFVPIRFPKNDAEERYNMLHRVTRVIIEQCFGILKRRYLVLHSEMRLQPDKISKIFAVCSMLHNIAIDRGLENYDEHSDHDDDNDHENEPPPGRPENQRESARISTAKRVRVDYINRVVRPNIGR